MKKYWKISKEPEDVVKKKSKNTTKMDNIMSFLRSF